MSKKNKEVLFNHLKKRIKSLPPAFIDYSIIDGVFFLHALSSDPIRIAYDKPFQDTFNYEFERSFAAIDYFFHLRTEIFRSCSL